MNRWIALLICFTALSCRQRTPAAGSPSADVPAARRADAFSLVLAPHHGEGRLDREIIRRQQEVRSGFNVDAALEGLGWSFVAKARASFDPGYYKLAEQCATALEARGSNRCEALLLRGHVLHNLHRFKEAEEAAHVVVAERGFPFDFGLLSDALMEQGRLAEAIEACQRMVDLRPDLHSYARGAHLRWLRGNVEGAEQLMRLAAGAASPLDSESAAWVNTRLAGYEFQLGYLAAAEQGCSVALEFQRDYPPALLLVGRMYLAQQQAAKGVAVLQRAAELNALPEYQWALAEALRANGQARQAAEVETGLRRTGAVSDPRTFSIYLATRGESIEMALALAEAELNSRSDVFTQDALAWSLAAAGRTAEAQQHMARALSEGTVDGRLFYHASIIARKAGQETEARDFASKASRLKHLLLPCEREQLESMNFLHPQSVVAAGRTDNNEPK